MISDLFPALALAMEAPDAQVLKRGPCASDSSLLGRKDLGRLVGEASLMAGLSLLALGLGIRKYGQGPRAQTLAFVTLTSSQLLHTFSSRSQEHSVFNRKGLAPNQYVSTAVLTGFALQCIPLLIPGVRKGFRLAPLGIQDLFLCGALAGVNFLVNESLRYLRTSRKRERANEV